MKFDQLMHIVADEPVFETGLLLAGAVNPDDVRRQLSRWTRAGQVLQLRRGLYALAPPFARTVAHPYLVANRLVRASYVSCQSVLAEWGLIPEHVPVTVSVTTGRPGRWSTPLGDYVYRRVQPKLFFGYRSVRLGTGQQAFVADKEKALLDLIYLDPYADTIDALSELRLQNLDTLDLGRLAELAESSGIPKLSRAVAQIRRLAAAERSDFETL